MRPCECDNVRYGPYTLDQCRLCWLAANDHRYQQLWGVAPGKIGPCKHLGDETGETAECPSCRGSVKVKLRACAVHGHCTTHKRLPAVACCNGCPDYDPKGPERVLVTAGIGDFFALESLLTDFERSKIRTVYYAAPAYHAISDLWMRLPNYRIERHLAIGDGKRTFHNLAQVEAVHGKIQATDLSIQVLFEQGRAYSGSSFLKYQLDEVDEYPPYAVVVPHSSWGKWRGRSFNPNDWASCVRRLEEMDLVGLVLYLGDKERHRHRRLIDLTNQTTMPQAIELLKSAEAYIGIDSALSVLAAKMDIPIWVKSVSGHCYRWKHVYFAPRTDFSFLGSSV